MTFYTDRLNFLKEENQIIQKVINKKINVINNYKIKNIGDVRYINEKTCDVISLNNSIEYNKNLINDIKNKNESNILNKNPN